MKLPKQSKPIRIQVPFELKEDIGVGDVIKRATSALGVKPCSGCEKRAEALNSRFVVSGRKPTR